MIGCIELTFAFSHFGESSLSDDFCVFAEPEFDSSVYLTRRRDRSVCTIARDIRNMTVITSLSKHVMMRF